MSRYVEFERWQHDYLLWQQQIAFWQHEIQRLVALLYLLEKSLPTQTLELDRHKERIAQHNAEICAQSRIMDTEDDGDVIQHHYRYRIKSMETRHQNIRCDHQRIRAMYERQFEAFRELATKLIIELEDVTLSSAAVGKIS